MKTNEQILERLNDPEIIDFFDIQKNILVAFLPFELAKPYLNQAYVDNYDELSDDEKWTESNDPIDSIIKIMPDIHTLMGRDNFMETKKGLLVLKALIWLDSDELYTQVEHYFMEPTIANMDEGLKVIAKHYGYVPVIEDIDFEEIPE